MINLDFDFIESIGVCECGAVTFDMSDGNGQSCLKENLEKFYGMDFDEIESEAEYHGIPISNYWNCNHCTNRWGIDICSCGSGEFIGECDCGSKHGYGEYNRYGFQKNLFEKGGLLHGLCI